MVSTKICTRNNYSGPGNGCANFMGAWHFWVLSAGKPHAHKIPLFRGGLLGFFRGGGGGSANFTFMGVGDFSDMVKFDLKFEIPIW